MTAMLGATVPKTSIHKDGKARARNHEIRIARNLRVSSPTTESISAKDIYESKFRTRIPLGLDARHDA
jgi:hypothetical protein